MKYSTKVFTHALALETFFCGKHLRLKLRSLTFKGHAKIVLLLNKIKSEAKTNPKYLNLKKL